MFKIAILHGQEVAREEAIDPLVNGKYNLQELTEFYHRVLKGLSVSCDNSREIQYYCRYVVL